jgi:ribonuclease HII
MADTLATPRTSPKASKQSPSKAVAKARMLRALTCDLQFEQLLRATGARFIAGVDEVGRGALFGPVVAAAVILPADCAHLQAAGLRDSKQVEPEAREQLALMVRACAVAIAIYEIDAVTIDRVNIYQATRLAMRHAVAALTPQPDHLLIDALQIDHPCAQTSIVYGDARSLSIAAASVVAKVHRDALICHLHQQFPAYGLDEHKGYGTPAHQRALLRYGPTPLHRLSFRPVWEARLPWDVPGELALQLAPVQGSERGAVEGDSYCATKPADAPDTQPHPESRTARNNALAESMAC